MDDMLDTGDFTKCHVKIAASYSPVFGPEQEYIQGVFFNWYPPKNHKYGKKLKYQNWYPPQIHKYQLIRRLTIRP